MASMLEDVEADLCELEEDLQATQDPKEKSKLQAEKRELQKKLRELQRLAGVTGSYFVAHLPTAAVSVEVYQNLARHHCTLELQLVMAQLLS